MKRARGIIAVIILVAGLLAGCKDARTDLMLSYIDTLIDNHPDSALQRLDSLKADKSQWTRSQRMRYDLLTMKAQNKAYISYTSDSIAKVLVDYYDSHGTPNDRLLAHYLLGCVYRDLGEAPRAVDCYLDAVNQVDTTAADCDYNTLSCVYSQLAYQYRKQLLLTYEIDARRKASHCAELARDTLNMIFDMEMASGAYMLLNKVDSGELVLKRVIQLYNKHGFTQKALQASTALMYLYVEKPEKLLEVKELIDRYEAEYDLIDKNGEVPPSKRLFYYYKGRYYDQMNRLDSAEYYYRKVFYPNMSYSTKDAMYRGLLSVFHKRHLSDSIAKYAKLFCLVNDSSNARRDQQITARMSASYNFYRFQRLAQDNEKKANRIKFILLGIIFLVIIVTMIAWNRYLTEKRKKQQELENLKMDYANTTDEYRKNLQTLQILEGTHKNAISEMLKELSLIQDANSSFKQQQEKINAQYETAKHELEIENEALKKKIGYLQKQEIISNYIDKSKQFKGTIIVDRFMLIAENPFIMPTNDEWEELVNTASDYYPELVRDINNVQGVFTQEIRLCILLVLSIRESDIARMMKVSIQRVTNIKSSLNKKLFDDGSARSFYRNLSHHYNIYS